MMTYIPLKEIALVIFSLFLYMVLLAILVIPIESLFGISPTFSAAILGVAWQISVLLFLFKYSIKKNLSYNFFGFSLPNSWKYYFIALFGSYLIFILYGLLLYVLEFFGVTNAIENYSGQELPFSKNENVILLVFITLSITIYAPVIEEILTVFMFFGISFLDNSKSSALSIFDNNRILGNLSKVGLCWVNSFFKI